MSMLNFKDMVAASTGDEQHMLGKFLYFTLASVLVDKEELSTLCQEIGMPYTSSKRLSISDAFRSATGDIRGRIISKRSGERKIYTVYCRDNEHSSEILSRELVKETINQRTNQYKKLANIYYDKVDLSFGYGDVSPDEDVDAMDYCKRAETLFELYQHCATRRQIENICVNYLRSLEATKVTGNGHNYFIPNHSMSKVEALESFFDGLNEINKNRDTILTANSFYIIDDAKQRGKMTEEFYSAVKKEIAAYQERADYLIKSCSSSPTILERWVLKISALEEKKRHYEEVLRRELDGLDDEFDTLKLLSQELSIRARGLRQKQAA